MCSSCPSRVRRPDTHVIRLKRLGGQLAANVDRARQLSRDLQELHFESKAIAQGRSHAAQQLLRRGLLPLLLDNQPEAAARMVRAFEKADLHAPLPVLKSSGEAISYLSGTAPFTNRHVHPLPNSVLLALEPWRAGLPLLQWIRGRPDLAGLPVIILGLSANGEDVREAYDHRASSYLVKPDHFEDLVDLVRSLDRYWSHINVGRGR